tara:strand:- start:3643 stop:4788 length:1146 start_codon:yes stop_codon:yes gene_type:complete
MVATHLHNFDTTTAATPPAIRYRVQAHALYHWLVNVNQFTLVEASGANWGTSVYTASDGIVNAATPQQFYSSTGVFDATFVDKFISIRDITNPTNSFVARITAVPSATQVTLDSSALLNVSSTGVDFIVFDAASSPPSAGDYFVIQNPATDVVPWQARCLVRAGAPLCLEWELGFIGGWNTGTSSWDLPVSTGHYMHDTVAQTFCVADPDVGYFYAWSEDTGGVASDRNAVWVGSLSPFHSPSDPGVPKDTSYSAIFGTSLASPSSNLSRDTSVSSNFVVGEMLDDTLSVIPVYVAQKRLLSSGNDMMSDPAASVNPFSSQQDDYDAVVFHRSPNQAWRGRVPGLRILNDAILNRTPLNSNNTYSLGSGIGSVWNGKAPLP